MYIPSLRTFIILISAGVKCHMEAIKSLPYFTVVNLYIYCGSLGLLSPIRIVRPRGYKTFFMLNSTEYENFPAHKC